MTGDLEGEERAYSARGILGGWAVISGWAEREIFGQNGGIFGVYKYKSRGVGNIPLFLG